MTTNMNTKPSLDELLKMLSELDAQIGRQHGRLPQKKKEGEDDAAFYKRLWNNYCSRKSRHRRNTLEKEQEKHYDDVIGFNKDADKFGITPKDQRRYINCFKSYYTCMAIERSYVKRMTGLNLRQIYELQKRTGYKPKPEVTMQEARADEKRRWERGEYL